MHTYRYALLATLALLFVGSVVATGPGWVPAVAGEWDSNVVVTSNILDANEKTYGRLFNNHPSLQTRFDGFILTEKSSALITNFTEYIIRDNQCQSSFNPGALLDMFGWTPFGHYAGPGPQSSQCWAMAVPFTPVSYTGCFMDRYTPLILNISFVDHKDTMWFQHLFSDFLPRVQDPLLFVPPVECNSTTHSTVSENDSSKFQKFAGIAVTMAKWFGRH